MGRIKDVIEWIFPTWTARKLERRVEKTTGLQGAAKRLRTIEKQTSVLKQKGKEEETKAKKEAKKKKASKAEGEAEKGAIRGVKAAEEVEESAEALAKIQERALGIIAGLKRIQESIRNYVERETQEEAKENNEINYISLLAKRIRQTTNYKTIDTKVLSYLKQFMKNLIGYLRAELGTEEGKEKDMKDMIRTLNNVVEHEMKAVLRAAQKEEGVFKKFEKKTRKDYTKDIRELVKSRKEKIKELNNAKNQKKKADPELIAKLVKEIALMQRQQNAATKLNKQLQATFKRTDKEIKESRKIVKALIKLDKGIAKYEKPIKKTVPKIEKKFNQMRSSFKKVEDSANIFETSGNIHVVALSISQALNQYMDDNKNVALMTTSFDTGLRNIVALGFKMARLTETYERMIKSLTDSETATSEGMEFLTKIMQSVTSDNEMNLIEGEVIKTLDGLNKLLDAEKRLENYLTRLVRALEYRLRETYSLISQLAEEDKRIIGTLENSSANLGQMMGEAVNRKIEIDNKYMSEVDKFSSNLQKRNAAAQRAYSQARRAA